jgi:hypothetical protein
MVQGARPFEGTSALTRLAGYCSVSPREKLYDLFEFINLVPHYPGPAENSKYDAFPRQTALDNLERVMDFVLWNEADLVVTLGVATSKVVFGERPPWFVWHEGGWGEHRFKMAASPHPGGTSMYWNDLDARQRGIEFWQELVRTVECGESRTNGGREAASAARGERRSDSAARS